jgi:hypothetical protein
MKFIRPSKSLEGKAYYSHEKLPSTIRTKNEKETLNDSGLVFSCNTKSAG